VSYGEEHPIAQGSDESAYSQNRRAEFDITSGGNNLRSP
jgi:outer membrane protein OmpA-like peptidoglycan-associated protein